MTGEPIMHSSSLREFGTQNKFLNLPDTSYWLSREEIILSYLYQRKAAVPQVLKKDLVDNSLTLRHVGHSADQLTSVLPRSAEADDAALHILEQATCALLQIHQLGVQHLDVALRNIATVNFDDIDVKILDFTHALCAHHKLQKPLPLIPVNGLHHERLVHALVKDWNEYFQKLGKICPTLNEDLSISDQEFTGYWTDITNVQLLCSDIGILCHSISNLALEIAKTVISNHNLSYELIKQANAMRNLTNEAGIDALDSIQRFTDNFLGKASHVDLRFSNATPIPKVTTNELVKKPRFVSAKTNEMPLNSKGISESNRSKWFTSRLFLSFLWLTAIANVYFIDHVVTNNSYVVSNSGLYACIFALFLCPVLVLSSLLFKAGFKQVLVRISLSLLLASQLFVVVDCISLSANNLFAWIYTTVLFIGSLLALLSASNKKG